MSAPVLLPAPLASDSLALGQLLVDPLNPESTSFISQTASPAVSEPQLQSRYQDVIHHDDQGRFVSSLSGFSRLPTEDNLLLMQADQMSYTSLRNPDAAFDALRRDTSAQSFLRKMSAENKPLYYVVGIQKLNNPTFKRAVVKEGSVAEAPSAGDPKIHLPRQDSATDLKEKNKDAVFGIDVRKVSCRVGSADEPHNLEDIDYSWSYHKLGGPEELQLSIGLGKPLEANELRALAGIVSDDDFTDQSYESDYSDDEGQAGF